MNYEKKKQKLRTAINKFDLFDNIFELCDALGIATEIAEIEGFPISDYYKWKKQNVKSTKSKKTK